ncbi:hypothetical protein PVAND_004064 [Polypedilum vanderplanki]|uniref:MADF domain-containing protein n=1 Tax=Polypedilum vanderplanki TaxID=319348 RepID=A0A9J6BX32_POLVA|nr:hypothetical protein PVAND_004064 [Polypedilum vanderplanki]
MAPNSKIPNNKEKSQKMEKKLTPAKQRWNEAKTKAFVLDYLHQNCLWNTSSLSYSQKAEKEDAYEKLAKDYGLTISEVKNKIRIFRTTYSQERKKEELNNNYTPKLSWYADMKTAFGEGKVKSFSKFKRESIEQIPLIKKERNISDSIEYDEGEYEEHDINMREGEEEQSIDHAAMFVEPYVDDIEEEEANYTIQNANNTSSVTANAIKTSSSTFGKEQKPKLQKSSSNEMFLQSLCSSLDQLSDEKNMRARIEMQQVLYKIMYEAP